MNKKQRNQNRANARMLRNNSHICDNCGERGAHWVNTAFVTLEDILYGNSDPKGFWICPKYYGEDGRRLT